MKFAGPSMGAALGSGMMQGYSSAREAVTREELERDKSAMSTYSKLVQSGEWEPVGKEGAQDGGVLRVGNVGLLKKVQKPQGMDLKAANILSQIQHRQSGSALAREKFEWEKDKPKGLVSYENPETGSRIDLEAGKPVPPGYYKVGVVNAPVMKAQEERTKASMEASTVSQEIGNIDREMGKLSKLVSYMGEGIKESDGEAVRSAKKRYAELKAQKDRLLGNKESIISGIGGRGPVKRVGELPPASIIPKETWRKVAKANGFSYEEADKAQELVLKSSSLSKLIDKGMLKLEEVFKWLKDGEEEDTVGLPSKVIKKDRFKVGKIPEFVK